MEVSEIIEIFICEKTGVVNVKFRMVNDSEDTVRMDTIELETLSDFGYTSSYIDMDFFDVDEDYELDGQTVTAIGSYGPNGAGLNQYDDDDIVLIITAD